MGGGGGGGGGRKEEGGRRKEEGGGGRKGEWKETFRHRRDTWNMSDVDPTWIRTRMGWKELQST